MAPKKLKPAELEEALRKAQQELEDKQKLLDDKESEVSKQKEDLDAARSAQSKLKEEHSEREKALESEAQEAREAADGKLRSELAELQESQQAQSEAVAGKLSTQEEELQSHAEESARMSADLAESRARLEEEHSQLEALQKEQAGSEKQLAEVREAAAEQEELTKLKEQEVTELQTRCDAQQGLIEEFQRDAMTRSIFLDVSFGDCEFANAFAFFMVVALKGRADKRSTDISEPSTRPTFKKASLLLPTDEHFAAETLTVSVYVSVPDPSLGPSHAANRLLGTAEVPLSALKLEQGSSASVRVTQRLVFTRARGMSEVPGSSTSEAQDALTVGRATLGLQIKMLTESERGEVAVSSAPIPPSVPSLDKELWVVKPFRHRLRMLVHRAEGLPPPSSGRSTARLVLRLLRPNGAVVCESSTADVPILSTPHSDSGLAEASFAEEVLLQLEGDLNDVRVQIALETASVGDGGAGGAPTTKSLLELSCFPESMKPMQQFHLYIRPSGPNVVKGPADSSGTARPRLLISLLREPPHEAIPSLGDGAGLEVRITGVSPSRPLPSTVSGALLAFHLASSSDASGALAVPMEVYYYDQRMDLTSFLETCTRRLEQAGGKAHAPCTVTPITKPSRTPTWGDFVVKSWVPTPLLSNITVHLYDMGARENMDVESPFGGVLVGFATLDIASLVQPEVTALLTAGPATRNFILDLRLLQAPGISVALEIECRVWSAATASASGAVQKLNVSSAAEAGLGIGTDGGFGTGPGTTLAGVEREAHEFRLNHELSVQLAKEFNMRAAALKRAGEEIVSLRRQIQILQNENDRLKSQIADEEALVDQVGSRPPPMGIENLSSSELALKLQRALEKYRNEKTKGIEVSRRLEEACRELQRLSGLKRALEELESTHMEQNKELQRLQDECRRIDTYRHLTKTQEKVIAKLEKSLESSLQEVHKAQRVQADIEQLKTENLRLREKCSRIIAGHRREAGPSAGPDMDDLKRQLHHKDDEITRLEMLVRDLRARQPGQPPTPELQQEKHRAQELEASQAEWEQRCARAESRVQALEKQLAETAKNYGGQILELKVQIAQKDARARELEILLKDAESSSDAMR
mmetsp:Transcript_55655/g.132687  ORF Transcript_55655/g.132687 Transcript_55655/m.132687 type:complete len:1101 (-) Transcript_55655:15-3317(-)